MWIHTCKVKCLHRPNGNYVNNSGFYQINSYSYEKQLWSQYNNQDILIYSVSFRIERLLSVLLISFVCYSSCRHKKLIYSSESNVLNHIINLTELKVMIIFLRIFPLTAYQPGHCLSRGKGDWMFILPWKAIVLLFPISTGWI